MLKHAYLCRRNIGRRNEALPGRSQTSLPVDVPLLDEIRDGINL
jgi:hypothetical protein